jgi:hypothetical protein
MYSFSILHVCGTDITLNDCIFFVLIFNTRKDFQSRCMNVWINPRTCVNWSFDTFANVSLLKLNENEIQDIKTNRNYITCCHQINKEGNALFS